MPALVAVQPADFYEENTVAAAGFTKNVRLEEKCVDTRQFRMLA
jgi:hypothetical protein